MIRYGLALFTFIIVIKSEAQLKPGQLAFGENLYAGDWLIQPVKTKAAVYASADKKDIHLFNGLVKRTFRLSPNIACIDYKNMITGQQLLRALEPEAILTINGKEYNVGGLHGQKEKAYLLPEWLDKFTRDENDFQFVNYETSELKPFINWQAGNWWTLDTKQPGGKARQGSRR